MSDPSPAPHTIAVLPFANLSGSPEKEYFSDGFAEATGEMLAIVHAVRVAPHTSSLVYKKRTVDLAEAGRRLGVAAVMDGGVRRTGSQIEITVQLVNTVDGSQRWTSRFDRAAGDVLAVQQEIARGVLDALGVTPGTEEQARLSRAPTADARAYDLWLQGRHSSRQLLKRSQEFALDLFEQAVAADKQFAHAYAAVATCHAMMFQYWDSSVVHLEAADTASARALELAPEVVDVRVARGLALSLAKRFDEAQREFEAALALRPDSFDAQYFLARSCRARGQMPEAAVWFEKACAVRPEDYAAPALLASVYTSLERHEDATAAVQRALVLSELHLERDPDDARALYLGAGALATLGDSTKARQWAKRAIAMDPDDSAVLYNVACAYAILRLIDSAIDCLEQAVAHGFGHWQWIEHDSDLDSLRSHPRFEALLKKKV